jgi:hypothetical protein
MASGALDWARRFIEVGQNFSSILIGSRALRWPVFGMVLKSHRCLTLLYLAAKPFHVGVVDVSYQLCKHTDLSM